MDKKLHSALVKDLSREVYDITEDGIYFPRHGLQASGEYFDRVNDGEWQRTENLVPKESRIAMLNTYLGSKAKPAGFYLALFSGSTAPADNWTGASFAAAANEIVSQTEGYAGASRPQFTPVDAVDNTYIDNFASYARVTIATSGSLNVTGAALLTSQARGATTGILISATKYAAQRVFQDGDTFDIGYRFALSN